MVVVPVAVPAWSALLLSLASAWVLHPPTSASMDGPPVAVTGTAPQLADSVGVSVHLYYNDTAYANAGEVAGLLRQLGVVHVRDGPGVGNQEDYAAAQMLNAEGVHVDWVLDPSTLPSEMAALDGPLAGTSDALEGPNELDCHDSNWVADGHQDMQELRSGLSTDPVLRQLPLLDISFCRGGHRADYGSAGTEADIGNGHVYAGGGPPEPVIASDMAAARADGGLLPYWITEDGATTTSAPQTLGALTTELRSKGRLSFRKPDHLEKVTTDPQPETLVVDGERLIVNAGNEPPRVVELGGQPAICTLVDTIRGALSGDLAGLRRSYTVTGSGTEQDWHIVLRPRDPAVAQLVTEVRLAGGAALRVLETVAPNGDTDTLTITPQP